MRRTLIFHLAFKDVLPADSNHSPSVQKKILPDELR